MFMIYGYIIEFAFLFMFDFFFSIFVTFDYFINGANFVFFHKLYY